MNCPFLVRLNLHTRRAIVAPRKGDTMKWTCIVLPIAIAVAFSAMGCNKGAKSADLVTPISPQAQANPHTGVKGAEIPAGIGHKGKVIDVLNTGEYSYIQIEENGKKLWVAAMSTKVSKGDIVEFPDSPPFPNFKSKLLNKTFDSVIFAAGIRNNGPSK